MRYFSGSPHDLGTVSALKHETFAELCECVLGKPIRLALTRDQFFSLDKEGRNKAKKVAYVTPATFASSPSPRRYEFAERCNLIALDIDDPIEARRLLTQRWEDCLGAYGYCVWHTASSTPEAPRLRVMVSAEGIIRDRYRDAARTVADLIGLATVTTESRVTVQPMFLPIQFKGESESPIIAVNPDGDPFLPSDIVAQEESSFVDGAPLPPSDVADLDYLRAPLDGVTLADAEGALATLDPDLPMQQWIEVAAGLKHQFDSVEAYQLWDKWSAKGKKYVDSEETKYRWDTLKAQPVDRAPITIRTVFKMAQARGWVNPALAKRQHADTLSWIKAQARSAEELLDQGAKRIAKIGPTIGQLERKTLMVALKDRLASYDVGLPIADIRRAVHQLELDAAKTTGVPPWAKGICFVTALNVFYRHTTDRRFAPEVIDLMYSVPAIGEDKPLRPRDFLIQIASVPQVENLRYDPSRGSKRFFNDGGVPYVNIYRPGYAAADATRAEEAGEIYRDHVEKLIKEPEYRQTLTDFLAYQVQHPGKKVRWAPLIQGAEGCGKTSLAVMMAAVLGRRNVAKVQGKTILTSNWNDWAYGHQLVVLEEVRVIGSNRHAVMDSLKPLITDDEISLEKRFEDHRSVENITNYLLFTNYHDSLAIREDGRRYFVLSSPLQGPRDIARAGGKKHFDRLYEMIRDNAGGLRSFFEQWTISKDFNPEGRAPVTPYLVEMADNAASPLYAAVREVLEEEPHPLVCNDVLSLGCLRGILDAMNLERFSDQAMQGVLREMGFSRHGKFTVDGDRHQLWVRTGMLDMDPVVKANLRVKYT